MKKTILLIIIFLFLISCESTPSSSSFQSFSKWYDPWIEASDYSQLITLKEGQQPKIRRSYNIDNDINELLSENYEIIGKTGFNGTASDDKDLDENIRKQCIQNGATIALYEIEYTDTRSGTFSSGGSYNIRRYDYVVYYFAESKNEINIIGLWVTDLNNKKRQELQRNTGAVVYVVYKYSPAFFANILKDDIIIKLNDEEIRNRRDFNFSSYFLSKGDEVIIEIIRNNKEQIIKFKL